MLEAIVGDVPSPDEPPEPQAIRFDDDSWLLDGALSSDILRDTFGLRRLPAEERGDYFTVGGFVMMHMRRIPQEGERFEWGGLSFEVADMDGSRINKEKTAHLEIMTPAGGRVQNQENICDGIICGYTNEIVGE